MKLSVIKLGGSVITKKYVKNFPSDFEKIKILGEKFLRKKTIENLIKEIYDAKDEKQKLILINGAGVFGHYLVYKYLNGGDVKIETIHQSVKFLNEKVKKVVEKYFICSVLHPFELCVYHKGNFITKKMVAKAKEDLSKNRVILSYGDIIKADKGRLGGYEVFSGDDIATELAIKLKAEKIVMVTDVDGVYDKHPKNKNAKLIPKICGKIDFIEFSRSKIDVSGEMKSKIEKLLIAAEKGVKSYIINGLKKGNLFDVMKGKNVGTSINPIC
ncbi:MAG: isopentenyl phosphate kinase [Candidatus Aenigmarchaeota archaeon]|nr:isopentenyl phosphate kinase [Candidatus Aenigmarchaeota archaeon]